MTKLLIATPAYGEMFYTPYVKSLVGLYRRAARDRWELDFASLAYADIAESRNFLLTHWYDKTDASHILFVDADMGFEAKLVADMLALGKPVVGVVAPRRQIDLKRLARYAAEGEPAERAVARAHDFILRPVRGRAPGRRKDFLEVEGCGAGILLIERGCVAAMLEKLPGLNDTAAKATSPLARAGKLDRLIRAFDPLAVDGARLSEDFAFCHRWRALCGGEIWASISHEIAHLGLHRFATRYADASGPRISIAMPGKTGAAAKTISEGGKGPKVVKGRLALPGTSGNGKSAKP